jgi:hypothetical protein
MKATDIGAYEAKTHWSRILAKVQQGRAFVSGDPEFKMYGARIVW